VILLDSDVLLLEMRYPKDPRFSINRQAIQQIQSDSLPLGVTLHTLLEVLGVLSFNMSVPQFSALPQYILGFYRLTVFPNFPPSFDYAGCSSDELIAQMSAKMALGDAVQAVQIARYASHADRLLTWNAKHFQGKIVIPVETPEDWLVRRQNKGP
jgi:hypothetical protein